MDIKEFFELCEGQWISQRTLHHIETEQTDVGKADLWIEKLDPSHESVVKACESQNLSVDQVVCPLEVTYKATLQNGRTQISSTLMIPVKSADSDIQGQVISIAKDKEPVLGTFSLGTDEVMTLSNQQGDTLASERIWFASENLRIRSITLTNEEGTSEANFCSEIRKMGEPQPKPSADEAAQQMSPLAAWRARQAKMQSSSN